MIPWQWKGSPINARISDCLLFGLEGKLRSIQKNIDNGGENSD